MEGLVKKIRAFTLVEILIDFTVLALVALAIISAYMAAYKSISLSKMKMTAVSLANEKMEILRNMPYDDLATAHGAIYPPGTLLDHEIINRNGQDFDVYTIISYVDDPYDGSSPSDIYPYDYKKIEINVGKTGKDSRLAKLTSNVSARAAETSGNTGIMSLCVIDALGYPVAGASVSIKNSTVDPAVNMENLLTGEDGCIMVPKLPPDEHNHYAISVTKPIFSQDSTYPRTAQNPNALQPDINVIAQQVTSLTLSIDELSKMDLSFVDPTGNPAANVTFTLELQKLIYNNPDTNKFSKEYTTDASGKILIPDLEFGKYLIKGVTPGYLVSTSPMQAIELSPNTTLGVTVVVSGSSTNPVITNFSPASSTLNNIASVTINGNNLHNDTTVMLKNSDGVTIPGTNLSVQPHSQIVADFDLNSVSIGKYDLIVTNSNGETVKQSSGFEVVNN